MSHSKPYPTYKDSDIEWIGKVPEHWDTVKIARLGPLTKANGGSKQDNVESGIPCIRYGDLYTTHEYVIRESRSYIGADKLSDYTSIQYGDALFAASGETFEDIGRSAVNLLQEEACCGGDVIVLRPATGLDPLFLGYTLDSTPSKAQKALMGKGYTVVHIYGDQLRDLVIALPPTSEQESIGATLSRETARIDTLIAKKTEFIELLAKKRQALITHAVTKGLKPRAKMRDSGVEWIGEVPEHWKITRIKFEASRTVDYGLNISSENYSSEGIRFLRTTDIDDNGTLKDEGVYLSESDVQDEYLLCQGDLLISRSGTIGRAYVHLVSDCKSSFAGYLVRFRFSAIEVSKYLFYVTKSDTFAFWLRSSSIESTIGNVNGQKYANFHFAMPEHEELNNIVTFIDRETARIDELVEKTQLSIDILKKRRSAFIAAAVTGKIDLRETT